MSNLTFNEVSDANKLIARELLTAYGRYLFDELKLMAGSDTFFKELDTFPDSKYQLPDGAFFIVYNQDVPIGCVGLKRFDDTSCELKRMYVKKEFRGRGFAKEITKFILDKAEQRGYHKVLLDTNDEMPAAVSTYLSAGFVKIPPYCENDNPHPVFLSYDLKTIR